MSRVHGPGSLHYAHGAADISGAEADMQRFVAWALRTHTADDFAVPPGHDFAVSVVVGVVTVLAVGLTWGLARQWFAQNAHLTATACFFGLIVAVACVNLIPRWIDPSNPPAWWNRVVYGVVAVGLVVDVAALILIVKLKIEFDAAPPVLYGEFIALGLFSLFWVVQTVQKWSDAQPSLAIGNLQPDT